MEAPALGFTTNGHPHRLFPLHHRLHVLLVEDSEDDVFFFRYTLKKSGVPCELAHVADGAEALRYLESALSPAPAAETPRPDLVFLDLKLPSFSGFEILAWLRARAAADPPRVVILSGSDVASDRERARQHGAGDYLVKPLTVDQLRERLAAAASVDASTLPVAKSTE